MKNILMIGAHYDDVELGCGGTASRLSHEGAKVYKMVLTRNEFHDRRTNVVITQELCKKSSDRACEILGMEELEIEQMPYGQLVYNGKMMKQIEDIIAEKNIDTVFMHYSSDMHHDHIVAYEICKTASRHAKNILTYQSNGYIKDRTFSPHYFVDITDFIEDKRKSVMVYEEDQKDQNNFGRLFDVRLQMDAVWGYGNGVKYAEGFEIIKMLA